jgi:F0F1-type ATP synthase membrane subunit b/b'
MKLSTLLQLFLVIDVFFMGALAAVAARHAYAHFKPPQHEPEKPHAPSQNGHLPPAVREHLLEAAQSKFQGVLDSSAEELQHDLQSTAERLNKQLDKVGTDIVGKEMVHYQAELIELRKKAEEAIGGAQAEITTHQAELKAKLEEDMAAEKQRLVQQLDTKLADAVASFLLETLQHNVDLGAQAAYLTTMLEEHKADFTKGISDETPASK